MDSELSNTYDFVKIRNTTKSLLNTYFYVSEHSASFSCLKYIYPQYFVFPKHINHSKSFPFF